MCLSSSVANGQRPLGRRSSPQNVYAFVEEVCDDYILNFEEQRCDQTSPEVCASVAQW